jgi:SAM-dependent methyltransferase
MTSCSELADYEWLTGSEAAEILTDLAGRNEPLHLAANRLRHVVSATRAHLLLDQVELRRRAAAKFARAAEMFFTRLGLEQATDEWVAGYKATRFAAGVPVADLCCGIGGDLLALADQRNATGVDRDPIAAFFATANSRVNGVNAEVQAADLVDFNLGAFAAWHIDPDRRPRGRRTASLDWSSPSREVVEGLIAAVPQAAIKLAPAAEVPPEWSSECELEWISRDRQCRQLVAWFELSKSLGQCRATVLAVDGRPLRSIVGQPRDSIPIARQLGRFLFEPDPAVLAAKLTGALAAELNLAAVSPGIPYLTADADIEDPAIACFEVQEVLPLQLKQLAKHLRSRNIGQLEIKKRGVDHDPQVVRKQLQLQGDEVATLLLTKLNGKHVAILVRRMPQGPRPGSLSPEC